MSAVCQLCGWQHTPSIAEEKANILVRLATIGGMPDPWLLDEDGSTDYRAVEVARMGGRLVKLTRHERLIAATLILEDGGHAPDVCEHLGLPRVFEIDWHKKVSSAHELHLLIE